MKKYLSNLKNIFLFIMIISVFSIIGIILNSFLDYIYPILSRLMLNMIESPSITILLGLVCGFVGAILIGTLFYTIYEKRKGAK